MGCSSSTDTGSPKQQWHDDDETDIDIRPVKIDRAILDRYMQLDREIQQCEGTRPNSLKNIEMKKNQAKDLEATIQQLALHYQDCVQSLAKDKADVKNMPSVREFFKDQSQYDERMSKEQEEYLDAINKQEVAKKELDGMTLQQEQLQGEIDALVKYSGRLTELYKEQDELLAGIFDGKYGSDQEFRLEMELDNLIDRQQRIGVAKYKWQNSKVLIEYAYNQLSVAVETFFELTTGLETGDIGDQRRRLLIIQIRNHLVAAKQNILSAQRYLNNIQFPYCKSNPDMDILTRAISNVYTDMQSRDRQAHALQCYALTQKQAALLLQWFDQVINTTILKELEKISTDTKQKTTELRKEQLRLIKVKIQQKEGSQVNLDVDLDVEDTFQEESVDFKGLEPDQVSNAGDLPGEAQKTATKLAKDTPPAPKPIPLNELAPLPNNDKLFGNIDEIRRQHEANIKAFDKAQQTNRQRMEQGIQEKLRARRSKKRRMDVQDEQAQRVK